MSNTVFVGDMAGVTVFPKIGPDVPNTEVAQVFNNNLLLEIITRFVLHAENSGNVCRKNLINLLLLSKSSNETTRKILEKAKEPLYTVTMNESNSLTSDRVRDFNTKILHKFSSFLSSRTPPECYKGFCLKIEEEVFRLETYDHLVSCLKDIGCYLVELDLQVPKYGGTFPGLFPNSITFPSLQKLKVDLKFLSLGVLPPTERMLYPKSNVAHLLQSLLTSGNNLKNLHIEGKVPLQLQYMSLPESLTTIFLKLEEWLQALECLIRNRLPNLKNLGLVHCIYDDAAVKRDLLYRVLQSCNGLRVLKINEYDYEGPPRTPILPTKFPVMANLQKLLLHGIHSELAQDMVSFSTIFPKLTCLRLTCQTVHMLQKWTKGTPAPLVTELELELVNEEKREEEDDDGMKYFNTLPVTPASINDICGVFPNITTLNLHHSGTQFAGLQHVFTKMGKLKKLTIIATATDSDSLGTSDDWDSLFIGAPLELVVGLASCPNYWKNVKLHNENEISIRLLKELEYLQLNSAREQGLNSLITDLSFAYALTRMRKLKHLVLAGRFSVSKNTMDKWEEKNRKIEYYPEISTVWNGCLV